MYKIYLSPSMQSNSFGINGFGTEEYRMNQIADAVERKLIGKSNVLVYRSKRGMNKNAVIEESNNIKAEKQPYYSFNILLFILSNATFSILDI